MSTASTTPGAGNLFLTIGEKTIPLSIGATIRGADVPGLGTAETVIARVTSNPQDPSIMGLQNLSLLTWTAHMPDGVSRAVEPQKTIRLGEHVRIDFAPTGMVFLRSPPQSPSNNQPIEREKLERLARRLHRAALESALTQDQFDRLHAVFFAHDDQGVFWSVGLRTRSWHKSEGGRWVPGSPPDEFQIDPATLGQLMALDQRLGAGGRP